jgi:hypothetical protein
MATQKLINLFDELPSKYELEKSSRLSLPGMSPMALQSPDNELWQTHQIPMLVSLAEECDGTLRLAERVDYANLSPKVFHFQDNNWKVQVWNLSTDVNERQYRRILFRDQNAEEGQWAWWLHFVGPSLLAPWDKNGRSLINCITPKGNPPFPIEQWRLFMDALREFLCSCFTEDRLKEILEHDRIESAGKPGYRKT